ncbi:EXOSC7 [Cordylochernes scorpioides]|uniref:Ribosomal RNA-processing protein 42 n=1 Tax=Cordylochernes scorpioides TaxID=51811 RepID=A0ABY6LBI1_9ARAC|nr:EXOSC7 [Cordylochernes scorpioides]
MTDILSETEKSFIIEGIQHNIRIDGRDLTEYRQLVLETGVSPNCNGSAHIRLANNDVLVGVKADLEETKEDTPSEGRLEFFVDCTANAAPQFEGRGGERLAYQICTMLSKAYSQPGTMDLGALSVMAGHRAWTLYVDVLILECGGSLMDAASLAVKAALADTKLPEVKVHQVENLLEVEVAEDPFATVSLDVSRAPVLVTLSRVGRHCVVDTNQEEEQCALSQLVLAVDAEGQVLFAHSPGFLAADNLEMLDLGSSLGAQLNLSLHDSLRREQSLLHNNPGLKSERGLFD